ncbi:protein translocase subunit SecF [candidate division WWE3 bacterium]|uniref:Protein-export membrane protein SecF n=1 Tax=candidate division WWE3 bacterium TaxID=2053526 RepID=A0A955EFE7_UNCKA|nr:protein translocase subunit SecF [candidate division WWE3 bacterium]
MRIADKWKYYFTLSGILLTIGVISLAKNGLRLGIDFTGGSIFEYTISDSKLLSTESVQQVFSQNGINVYTIDFRGTTLQVRTNDTYTDKSLEIIEDLQNIDPNVRQVNFETIGPSVSSEITRNGIKALFVAILAVILYIAYAFRNVPKKYSSYKFGVAAIIALLHDALFVLGVFSILGFYYGVEVNALFITAMLTVIGFSVHDTIVVFDRIRENLKKHSKDAFIEIANISLLETLNRSLSTSFTAIVMLTALVLLGGESIRYFVLAILVGLISGAYSSIFIATPVLVLWSRGK